MTDFEEFVLRTRPRLTRVAHMIVGSNAVAEEIVQECHARMVDRWESIATPDAYARKTVVNLARNHLRRDRRNEAGPAISAVSLPAPELDETWAAVLRLPDRQRAVLVLRYYEDLTEAETAEVLGCRVGTVKSAHHRALAALRKELT